MYISNKSEIILSKYSFFFGFLLIFYVLIIAAPIMIISYFGIWNESVATQYSERIFYLGLFVFFISKMIDIYQYVKKNYGLCSLFFQVFLESITPALFAFGMFKMDVVYYSIVTGISCILLAFIYSKKVLLLEKKTAFSKMELARQDIDIDRAKKLLDKIDSNYAINSASSKEIGAQAKWIIVVIVVAGLSISLVKLISSQ